jgi:hypothetical protein
MVMKKKFDAITESRKWRIATGRKLSEMTEEERLAYLNEGVAEKLQALQKGSSAGKERRSGKTSPKQPVHA